GTTGQRVIGNTVYDNVTAGINLEGSSTGGTIENNICVDNGINSPRTHSDIRVENGSTAGTVVDDNVVYLTTPDTLLIWSSVSYKTLAAFQTASGQMLNGINADPKWRNPASADFHLTAGSPAIDSADSGVSGWPATDVEGNSRYEEPNTPKTGAAPLLVSADASGSSDTDATPIASYSFDFGDGSGSTGPQTGATASHSYSSPGSYTVTVTVRDSAGLSSSATAQLTVSTNLVTNAGFETDLSGWSTSGSDA